MIALLTLAHRFNNTVLFFLLLLAISVSCTFEPDENFVNVDDTPKVELAKASMTSVNLLEVPDTINLFARNTKLKADFNFKNVTLSRINIYIDDKLVRTAETDSASFIISAPEYSDGFHKIQVETFTNSGTGSIADKLGREVLFWEKAWTFSLNRKQPPEIKITTIAPRDGQLFLEWEASSVPTEKKIDLKYGSGFGSSYEWSYTITDPSQTSLIDNRFIEGPLSVSITNIAIDPALSSPKTTKSASFPLPTITGTTVDSVGRVKVKWNRSLFYKNVKRYSIEYNGKTVTNHSGSDSTLTTDKIPFWGRKVVVFRTFANNLVRTFNDTLKLYVAPTVSIGQNIGHTLEHAIYAPDQRSLGFSVDNSAKEIRVLDGETIVRAFPMDTLSSLFTDIMAISNTGEFLFIGFNGRVIRMDRDGNVNVVLDTKTSYGKHIDVGNLSIGGDRFICFDNKRYVNTLNVTSYLFDAQDNVPLWERYDSDTYYNLENSITQTQDGKYIVLHDPYNIQVLTRDGINIVNQKTISITDRPQGSYFYKGDPANLILASSHRVNYYNPLTETLTSQIIEGAAANIGVTIVSDPIKGYYGYRYNGFYYVIDPIAAKIVRKIPIESYTNRFTLYNGSLYAGSWKCNLKLP